jgi:hypothetical protein
LGWGCDGGEEERGDSLSPVTRIGDEPTSGGFPRPDVGRQPITVNRERAPQARLYANAPE